MNQPVPYTNCSQIYVLSEEHYHKLKLGTNKETPYASLVSPIIVARETKIYPFECLRDEIMK